MTLSNEELEEIFRDVITERMAKEYLVETEGYPNDAEENHYFNTEAGKEYREMLINRAKTKLEKLIADKVAEARIDEGERIQFHEFRGLLFESEDEYGNPVLHNRNERREKLLQHPTKPESEEK